MSNQRALKKQMLAFETGQSRSAINLGSFRTAWRGRKSILVPDKKHYGKKLKVEVTR